MLEERDARIAVLEAALEPFAKVARILSAGPSARPLEFAARDWIRTPILTYGDIYRAAAAYPTHSEGGEADKTRDYGPNIAQPLSDEGSAAAISPMQVQHANEAWNAQPAGASEEDRMKAALETVGASTSKPDEGSALVNELRRHAWRAAICTHAELAGRGDEEQTKFWKHELAVFDRVFPDPRSTTASPSPSALAAQTREKADLAICGIGHLLSHLPDDDNGFSEMKNEDLLYIYAVYVAELMKRDPTDPVGVMFAHLTKLSPKGGA